MRCDERLMPRLLVSDKIFLLFFDDRTRASRVGGSMTVGALTPCHYRLIAIENGLIALSCNSAEACVSISKYHLTSAARFAFGLDTKDPFAMRSTATHSCWPIARDDTGRNSHQGGFDRYLVRTAHRLPPDVLCSAAFDNR